MYFKTNSETQKKYILVVAERNKIKLYCKSSIASIVGIKQIVNAHRIVSRNFL